MARQVKLQSEKRPKNAGVFVLFGLGYVARALLPALKRQGFSLYASVRTQEQAKNCAALGVMPLHLSGKSVEKTMSVLRRATHILSSAPPNKYGDPIVRALNTDLLAAMPRAQWVGYLSATSVYGDRKGHWLFEEELLRPSHSRGRQRVLAELDWYESGLPVHIFRLASLYGKGRSALITAKKEGAQTIIKNRHITNRIHVDDIVSLLVRSIACPNPLRIYNAADGNPAPPQDVLNYAAKLQGIELPQTPYSAANLSPLARSFYQDERRISSARAQNELRWTPQYPSYKEGLTALFKAAH